MSQVDELLDVVDADNFALGPDQVGENVSEVTASGADVQDAGGRVQVGEEGFGGGGMHMGGGDCGAVADGLGGVLVGEGGGVMGAVDLLDGNGVSGLGHGVGMFIARGCDGGEGKEGGYVRLALLERPFRM